MRLLALKDSSHTHTSTNAHAGNTQLLALALEFRQQGSDLASTSAAQRMAESNGTTLGVDLFVGDTKLVDRVDGLGSESLVDFENVDIVQLETSSFDGNRDGESRANTHDARRNTNDRSSDVLAEDGETELLGGLALHQEDGSGAIRDLGGVTGGGGAVLVKGRAQFGELLRGGARADTIVAVNKDSLFVAILVGDGSFKGNNLILEPAVLLGNNSLGMRRGGESILLLACDTELGSDVLRGDTKHACWFMHRKISHDFVYYPYPMGNKQSAAAGQLSAIFSEEGARD